MQVDVQIARGYRFVPVELQERADRWDGDIWIDDRSCVHWGPTVMRMDESGELQQLRIDETFDDRMPVTRSSWESWREEDARNGIRGFVEDCLNWTRNPVRFTT